MIGGACEAVKMYVDVPRQADLGTLSAFRSLPCPKPLQSQSDVQVAAPCHLDNWLMQQQSADPADTLDEDYELTTSSITVAEDRSRRMLYDDPDEMSSPSRPQLSEVAAAMIAAGTLSGGSQMHLSHKCNRALKRTATVRKTLTRGQRISSSGAGANARNKSPGRSRIVATPGTSYTFAALPGSVPVPIAAAISTTNQTRGRTSPLRRSNSRPRNSFQSSVDLFSTVPALWSDVADGLLSPRAKVATLGSRGLVSSRTMLPRANSTGRQRKNLLEDLKKRTGPAQEAILGLDFAERRQPLPVRPSHSWMRVPHDARALEPYPCIEESTASTATPPPASNPHPSQRNSRVIFTSTPAAKLEAVASWESGTRAMVAPAYGGDPRPLGMLDLPGTPLLVGNVQEDAAVGHGGSLCTASEPGMIPTTPLAAWLALSLHVADCDGANGAGKDNDVGHGRVLTLSPVLASSVVNPVSTKECSFDGPAPVLKIGACPEPMYPEAWGTLAADGAGVCTAATTPGTGAPQETAMKEPVAGTPRGVPLLEDRNASFSDAFGLGKPSLGSWPLAATTGLKGRSGLSSECDGQRSSTKSIVEPVQVPDSSGTQHEVTRTPTVEAPSPRTSVVDALVTKGLLSISPCLTATSQLLAIEDSDVLQGAPPALVRELIDIVQSQAAQIKDLYNCLSESRPSEVPEGMQEYTKRRSPTSGVGHSDLSRAEMRASGSGAETAGCSHGGSNNGGTLNAEVRLSFGQLMASHSSSTHYHDSVRSLRSSREIQELLSCAIDGFQDKAGCARRDGLQVCAGPSRLRQCSQDDSDSKGGDLASTPPDLCVSVSETSADPVAYDSWWISNGRGRGVRGCPNLVAGVDWSDSTSREAGVHELKLVSHSIAAARGPTGHPRETIANQQEMSKLRLNNQAEGSKEVPTSQPGLKDTSERLERARSPRDSAHDVQERRGTESGGLTCGRGLLDVSNELLVDKNHQEQQDREPQQVQEQAKQETSRACRIIQTCFDEQQGMRPAAEHDLLDTLSNRHQGKRRVKLEVNSRERGLINDGQNDQTCNLGQDQHDSIQRDYPLEREISYQDQDVRAKQETQTSPNLQPSWNRISKAFLSCEFHELRQRMSHLEFTASQECQELRHQREHEPEQSQQGQRSHSRESRIRAQQEPHPRANVAVAPSLVQEAQPGSNHQPPTQREQQLEISQYDIDQGRRLQAQEMRLSSLIDTVASLQQEVQRQEESRRVELDQLAKGMEHIAACMLAALRPHAAAVSAGTGSACSSPTPLPNGSPSKAQDAESEAVGAAMPPLLVGAKNPSPIPCPAASEAIAAVGQSRSAGRTSSAARAGGHPAWLSSDEVQRQLYALQQKMRRMRAVMAAQVVVSAAGAASAGGGIGDSRRRHWPQQHETSSLQVSAVPLRLLPGTLAGDAGDSVHLHPQHDWELKQQLQLKEVQQQMSQLRREFSELRSGEALIVEAQEAMVDLVKGMRLEVDNLAASLLTFTSGMGGLATEAHTAKAPSSINGPGPGPKRRNSLLQELCSSQFLADYMSQLEQECDNQSGAAWSSQEPYQRSNLIMRYQHSEAKLPDHHQHQSQSDQVADIVATIQSVNSMLNDSLMQVMSKIKAQGEEIAELKRATASGAAGQRQRYTKIA